MKRKNKNQLSSGSKQTELHSTPFEFVEFVGANFDANIPLRLASEKEKQKQRRMATKSKRGETSSSRQLILLLLTSGFFIAGLLFDYMPSIVDTQIKRTVELVSNEEIQSLWSRPPVDFHSYYWLYDVLNAE